MANEILNFTNSLLSSVNAVNGVWSDYTQKQAELSTDIKQSRLHSAINSELARIKQDTHYENWNDEINTFFENCHILNKHGAYIASYSDNTNTYILDEQTFLEMKEALEQQNE